YWFGTALSRTSSKHWRSRNTSSRTRAAHSRRSAFTNAPLLPDHRIEPVAQRDDLVLHRYQFRDRAVRRREDRLRHRARLLSQGVALRCQRDQHLALVLG